MFKMKQILNFREKTIKYLKIIIHMFSIYNNNATFQYNTYYNNYTGMYGLYFIPFLPVK